jgi:hypothetical protein
LEFKQLRQKNIVAKPGGGPEVAEPIAREESAAPRRQQLKVGSRTRVAP